MRWGNANTAWRDSAKSNRVFHTSATWTISSVHSSSGSFAERLLLCAGHAVRSARMSGRGSSCPQSAAAKRISLTIAHRTSSTEAQKTHEHSSKSKRFSCISEPDTAVARTSQHVAMWLCSFDHPRRLCSLSLSRLWLAIDTIVSYLLGTSCSPKLVQETSYPPQLIACSSSETKSFAKWLRRPSASVKLEFVCPEIMVLQALHVNETSRWRRA